MNTGRKRSNPVTIRMDRDLYNRVKEQQGEGETITALYSRLLELAVESLEHENTRESQNSFNEEDDRRTTNSTVTALLEQLTRQGEQLSAALEQNAQLTSALKGEQETAQAALALQGIAQAKKQLEDSDGMKKRGLWTRFKETVKGEK